jgi:hypothetical protein
MVMRIAIITSLLAVGCGVSSGSGDDDGPVGTPENPQPAKDGPYTLRNTIDFTAEAILPPQLELVVVTLRDFEDNPAHAIISIADRAGVPAVGALYDAIPGIIKDRIEGWINDEIEKIKIGGKPVNAYAGDVADLAEFSLTQFAIDSELDMKGSTSTHRLTALDLSPTGIVDLKIPIGGLAGDILTQSPTIQVSEGGSVALSEQHFGLNYGEYAWQGIDAASTALFGGGVRETLGKAINCAGLAKTISDKCVLGVCVGHETEIRAICTGGLDAMVGLVKDRITEKRLEALHFASGNVRLVDDDGDGVGDRLVEGTWEAELNIGLGLRHAPATFEGAR